MVWLLITFIAIAVSFDSLAIGFSYGVAQVAIPLKPRLVLSLISGVSFGAAMGIGRILEQWLDQTTASTIGGILLVLLGVYTLWRSIQPHERPSMIVNVRIPVLGLIIQVFREPLAADSNRDNTISISESAILGITLAFDSLAAGIGGAMLGLPILPSCIAVTVASLVFLSQGIKTGERISSTAVKNSPIQWIPGVLIMIVGILRILM